MAKLIKFPAKSDEEKAEEIIDEGVLLLYNMPIEKRDAVLIAVQSAILGQVVHGLGLNSKNEDDHDDDEEHDLSMFDEIDKLYQLYSGDCYFCNHGIDPKTMPFDKAWVGRDFNKLCMNCHLKLKAAFRAFGVLKETA